MSSGSTESERLAVEFYRKLGVEGLRERFSADHTEGCIRLVLALGGGPRTLDVACGVGRLTIPLAEKGLKMTGLDLSAEMISAAESYGQENGLAIPFVVGSMLDLPFPDRSFDRVFCFRTLDHLLLREEQIKALNEMLRVLETGGVALIESNDGSVKYRLQHRLRHGRGPEGRVLEVPAGENLTNTAYVHDKDSLTSLAESSICSRYSVKFANLDHRRRIILGVWK